MPDEIEHLPPGEQLLFVKGERPIRAEKLCYYEDPFFIQKGRPLFDENPTLLQDINP